MMVGLKVYLLTIRLSHAAVWIVLTAELEYDLVVRRRNLTPLK
jgi:hypothetical protein